MRSRASLVREFASWSFIDRCWSIGVVGRCKFNCVLFFTIVEEPFFDLRVAVGCATLWLLRELSCTVSVTPRNFKK